MQENNSAKELEQENSAYLKDNVEDILCHLYAKLLMIKPPDPVNRSKRQLQVPMLIDVLEEMINEEDDIKQLRKEREEL